MTALRLLYWCQFIPPEDLRDICTDRELADLSALSLIKEHKRSGTLVLTSKGISFMQSVFHEGLPDLTYSYHTQHIQRRLRLERLVLTAYRAHMNVFLTDAKELSVSPSLYLSSITRKRGSNPWGSTRIAAIADLGDSLYAAHYVCPAIGLLSVPDELSAFMRQTAQFRDAHRALLFFGESYRDILTELERPPRPLDSRLVRYGDFFRQTSLPVHLLPCNMTGTAQLSVMSVPDYRTGLTKAALKGRYEPPPEDMSEWDALFQGTPFVMAADMDLRRLDTAVRKATARGNEHITMACLTGQEKEMLLPRYRNRVDLRIFTLTPNTIASVTGTAPGPHRPARTQFLTEKGEVVDAPPIKADRKAGG